MLPPANNEGSSLSTSSPALGVVFFGYSLLSEYKVFLQMFFKLNIHPGFLRKLDIGVRS